MRRVLLGAATAVALALAGCAETTNSAICKPIGDSTIDGLDRSPGNLNEGKARTLAQDCLHRNAYRLAQSDDTADIVARAVVEACEADIGVATALLHKSSYDSFPTRPIAQRTAEAGKVAEAAKGSYREYALLKVVEGRAGDCDA